jgi:UDP-glucose 4-epimerase
LARAYGRSFGLDCVVLRYFNAYGPRQRPDMAFPRVVGALAGGAPFTLYGDGEQSRSFTFVSDVVEGTIVAMERAAAGTLYNVGGGQEATMNEAIATLERIAGRTLDMRRGPPVPGDQRRTKADTTLIRSELGWEPRVTLEEGLRATWEWARDSRLLRESLG